MVHSIALICTGRSAKPAPECRQQRSRMKGDLHVVQRIQKRDRRLSKVSNTLLKKLSKTSRNKALTYSTVRPHCYSSSDFARSCEMIIHQNTLASRRRLLRAKQSGRRVLNVCDISHDDDVIALIVSERSDCGVEKIATTATKTAGSLQSVSEARVCLFGDSSSDYTLQKLHLDDGQQLFYVSRADRESSEYDSPWALGLDKLTFKLARRKVARMLGVRLSEDDGVDDS